MRMVCVHATMPCSILLTLPASLKSALSCPVRYPRTSQPTIVSSQRRARSAIVKVTSDEGRKCTWPSGHGLRLTVVRCGVAVHRSSNVGQYTLCSTTGRWAIVPSIHSVHNSLIQGCNHHHVFPILVCNTSWELCNSGLTDGAVALEWPFPWTSIGDNRTTLLLHRLHRNAYPKCCGCLALHLDSCFWLFASCSCQAPCSLLLAPGPLGLGMPY